MRLLALTVRNYRVHREIAVTFDSARTLIGGPNESGKSTLAEAAHRALFLRAKTGGGVQKEMVSTLHHGDPQVVLTFEAAGTRWELEKRFAGAKGSARLTAAGGVSLRDEEAEVKLADLLKSETAGGRGAAGLLPGLWSHLWVWQGSSGDDPSSHTAPHREGLVRHLQQNGAADVLQSAADQRVASRIADSYLELFTHTGRAKAGSKPELARIRVEEAEAALERSREAAVRLAQAADDHARAEREIAEVSSVLPKLRDDRAATEARLQEVTTLQRDEAAHLQAAQIATTRRAELESRDRAIREVQAKLTDASAALQPADAKLATLTEALARARTADQSADRDLKDAAEALRGARLHHDLANAAVTSFEKSEAYQVLAARVADAAALQDELATLRSDLAKLPVLDSKDLARLRKLDISAAHASAALEAMATGIELVESDAPVELDGGTLTAGEVRILTDLGELKVGEGTRLRIRPGGGQSLAEARGRVEAARGVLMAALQSLALRDLEHATLTLEQRHALEPRISAIEDRWKSLGGPSLGHDLARSATERDVAREELQRRIGLASSDAPISPPSDLTAARQRVIATRDALAAVESAEAAARRQSEYLRGKLDAAETDLQRHRDATAAARQAVRDLETALATREEADGDAGVRIHALAAARESEVEAAARLATTQRALTALNPELLTADLNRYVRALAAQEGRLREVENIRLIARDRLALDGSTDPEADLRFAAARHAAARDRYASELRRAKAIELLHQLFTSSREAIDRALVQPLADRISGYLQCLFGPGTEARVQLSDSGMEGLELIRPGDPAFSFASLSGGAKEQTAAAVRLALAEILAADHDGSLPIVFDDAFAHSDPARIQVLQRMLDLAAVRGLQVIVLTCTPADYSGFGAGEIRLARG